MRVFEKNRVKKILCNVVKKLEILRQNDGAIITNDIIEEFSQCQQWLIIVGEFIENNLIEYNSLIGILENICEAIYVASQNQVIEYSLLNDIINDVKCAYDKFDKYNTDKVIVLFLPYKVSMWDSLHSVYEEAVRDEGCETYVMPIPYYEKKNLKREFKFEYSLFEKNLNLLYYKDVDLAKMSPDIIYIHNPYDNANYVTEVDEMYFSKNLKKYTDMLVYVPYYISGRLKSENKMIEALLLPGSIYADVVICQSMIQKDVYKKNGLDSEKYIVCGSPKFDEVINYSECHSIEEQKRKFGIVNKKKIVLVNTSIEYFLNEKKWFDLYQDLFDNVSNLNVIVIWRPHPLLEVTIKSMRPDLYQRYREFCKFVSSKDNVVIDKSVSPLDTLFIADALISDYSSLLFQFFVTGKPLYSVDGEIKYREEGIVIFDYYDAYLKSDNLKLQDFVNLIIEGRDWKKEKRLKKLSEYSILKDGKCGKRIHDAIMKKIKRHLIY